MAKITAEIDCGKVYCSTPIARATGVGGCRIGTPGGWCPAFKVQRKEGGKDYRRCSECLAAEIKEKK